MVKKKLYIYSNVISLVLGMMFCFLAYGLAGIPVAIVVQIVLGILLVLGFIPVLGVVLFAWLSVFGFLPWFLSVLGLEWTWAITAMFFMNLVVSIGATFQGIIRVFTTYWRI